MITAKQKTTESKEAHEQLQLELASENRRLSLGLNKLLASLMVLFHQYQKHRWFAKGPNRNQLGDFYADTLGELRRKADAVANRIIMLTGTPISHPMQQARRSFVEHESTGEFPLVEMLQADYRGERKVKRRLQTLAKRAHATGDCFTETLLRGLLNTAGERMERLRAFIDATTIEDRQAQNDSDAETLVSITGKPILGPNW